MDFSGTWETLWSGSITAGGTATLTRTAKVMAIQINASTAASQYNGIIMFPVVTTNTLYIPVQYSTTTTYLRCAVNGTTFELTAVGNSNIYVKTIYGLV